MVRAPRAHVWMYWVSHTKGSPNPTRAHQRCVLRRFDVGNRQSCQAVLISRCTPLGSQMPEAMLSGSSEMIPHLRPTSQRTINTRFT